MLFDSDTCAIKQVQLRINLAHITHNLPWRDQSRSMDTQIGAIIDFIDMWIPLFENRVSKYLCFG